MAVLTLGVDPDEIDPVPLEDLSEKARRFVELVTTGNNPTDAARIAGYSGPETSGWRLIRNPKIAAAVYHRAQARVMTEGAAVGIGTLLEVAKSPKASPAARVAAANSLLDRAGIISKKAENQGLAQKNVADMDLSELDAFIKAGSAALQRHRDQASATDAEIVPDIAQPAPIDAPKA